MANIFVFKLVTDRLSRCCNGKQIVASPALQISIKLLYLDLLCEGLVCLEDLWVPEHLDVEGTSGAASQVAGGHRVLPTRRQRHLQYSTQWFSS